MSNEEATAASGEGTPIPKLDMSAAAADAAPEVDSPVARGDISPTSGQYTFELVPKAGKKGKSRRRKGKKGKNANRFKRNNNSQSGYVGEDTWDEYASQVALPSADVVRRQLDFRFSADMLSTDLYLRRNMDVAGYVPVWIIAQLGEFAQWGPSIFEIIRNGAKLSALIDYDADTDLVRLKCDWEKWLFPATAADNSEEAHWGSQWHVFALDDEFAEEDVPSEEGADAAAAAATASSQLSAAASEYVPPGTQ